MVLGIITVLAMGAALMACLNVGFVGIGWLWAGVLSFFGVFLGSLLVLFLVVWIAAKRVDQSKPQEGDSKFYRFLVDQIIAAGIPLLGVRVKAEGMKQIPKTGRFLLVCNHIHDLDPAIILAKFRKSQLAFISKRENSSMFLVGPLMHKIQCQLVNRENDREALKTVLRCIDILQKDQASIAVFPEGYVSRDGNLQPLKPGVFKIAQRANVPVVVCTLRGTKQILKNALRFRSTQVNLRLLTVLPAEQVRELSTVELAHRVHELMEKL